MWLELQLANVFFSVSYRYGHRRKAFLSSPSVIFDDSRRVPRPRPPNNVSIVLVTTFNRSMENFDATATFAANFDGNYVKQWSRWALTCADAYSHFPSSRRPNWSCKTRPRCLIDRLWNFQDETTAVFGASASGLREIVITTIPNVFSLA